MEVPQKRKDALVNSFSDITHHRILLFRPFIRPSIHPSIHPFALSFDPFIPIPVPAPRDFESDRSVTTLTLISAQEIQLIEPSITHYIN